MKNSNYFFIKHTKKVNKDTWQFLTASKESQKWMDFSTAAIVAGILNAVFTMVFDVAHEKKTAIKVIEDALKRFK